MFYILFLKSGDEVRDHNTRIPNGIWARRPARIRRLLGKPIRGVFDPSTRRSFQQNNIRTPSEAGHLRVEAEEKSKTQVGRPVMEFGLLERQLDRHRLTLYQIREQHEVFR